jgi:uncharacterized membrane protein
MRKTLLAMALIIGALLIVGSSGNFRAYTASRSTTVGIVSGEDSYVAFSCPPAVEVKAGNSVDFTVAHVENLMDVPIVVHIEADFSGLPDGASGAVDAPNAGIQPNDATNFTAHVNVSKFADGGTYEIPVTIYATWDGGSAKIEACSAVLKITTDPIVIEKKLVSGNSTFPVNTHQTWVFEVRVKNNGDDGNFTVLDIVNPGLFEVTGTSASAGEATVHHGSITWEVHLNRGETATLLVSVENICLCHHHYSTFIPGDYLLNPGACVVRTQSSCCHTCHHHEHHSCCMARSNSIIVTAVGGN